MVARTHAGSPTPPHLHLAIELNSVEDLTNEVLATAYLLQQQIYTLENLAHATEERETTLLRQRSRLQDLLRLVTHMETTEVRATASLQETLVRTRTSKTIRSSNTFRLSNPALPFPGLASYISLAPPSSFCLDTTPPGDPGDPSESPSLADEKVDKNREGDGSEQGETPGNLDIVPKKQSVAGGDAENTPLQFASIKAEEGSDGDLAPRIDPCITTAGSVPSAGGMPQANRSVGEGVGRSRTETEPGAWHFEVDKRTKQEEKAEQPETAIGLDPRLLTAPAEGVRVQPAPTPFRARNERAGLQQDAADLEGSWRARKPTPSPRTRSGRWRERDAALQSQAHEDCAAPSAPTGGVPGPSEAARTKKGGKEMGRSSHGAGTQAKHPEHTPSPRKKRVSAARAEPSPPRKTDDST
ncbi:hypothetical protein BD309DRAFT_965955 [Dichomitus squalens]|nr:hypothetical protein BD309DRAFT_965955 [Dichomitus squalens]